MSAETPTLSPLDMAHWKQIFASQFDVTGKLLRLNGEYDTNIGVFDQDKLVAVAKITAHDCPLSHVEMQIAALAHITKTAPDVPVPRVIPTKDGHPYFMAADTDGQERLVWIITSLDGKPLADICPHNSILLDEIGYKCGQVTVALADFTHPGLSREMKWDLTCADWVYPHISVIDDLTDRQIVGKIIEEYRTHCVGTLAKRPKTPIHNDPNDYNLLVTPAMDFDTMTPKPSLTGIVDFGDMIEAPAVCDLAILAAYMVLGDPRPLEKLCAVVAGYHRAYPLTADDIALVYPLLLTRLAVSMVNAGMMAKERPDDSYVMVSQAPIRAFLHQFQYIGNDEVTARLRLACGLDITSSAAQTLDWINNNKADFAPVFGFDLADMPLCSCAVGDSTLPQNPTNLTNAEAISLIASQDDKMSKAQVGHYLEPRLVYTEDAFLTASHPVDGRRTMHLGIDVFAASGQNVFAPYDGIVVSAVDRAQRLNYGGVVVLAHKTADGDDFYTLYGHLDPHTIAGLTPGLTIAKGTKFAALGSVEVNGGWQPHLHFQLGISLILHGDDWPGVADPDDLALYVTLYPNPAVLLGLDEARMLYNIASTQDAETARAERFGANLKLSYKAPVMLLRGWRNYLYDQYGRTYLDAYNNVPHVGHAHPRLQAIAARQLQMINTNTRYLHPAQIKFADALRARLPTHLDHFYFLTSGSEANELALRLARAHTGQKHMIVQDHAYHGHTTGTIDISPYKFNGPGGEGAPDWVEVIEVADPYRGRFGYDDRQAGAKYAAAIDDAVVAIGKKGAGLAGFIAESFPSVGGQIIPPQGYLKEVYARVRKAGGVCIADEVQTGLGRLGHVYWGFEKQDASPDMVVLGKPVGNGHPIGVVATTKAIADSFVTGMEFFSTFGGTTLACLIGAEVLNIIDEENLQKNAETIGHHLLDGYRKLQDKYPIIGDVRGMGLFTGIELVTDRTSKTPATQLAVYVSNRLRAYRILIGTDGPWDNVLKIRPPLTINQADADLLLSRLDSIMHEAQIINDA
ncbi:aminotransferase class III-fold pyridoxal phosphate-dependent enzyme [Candidatus Puniceispirillum sp.]|uniref:aminotransferase class III-fold pyridoxal phosphate-dependent enzyme n=1 Tax=Candidatus Puniceispirillum sp. TaxID=2026719 RepID=UPI001ED1CDE7|nr:aminotransferase class III-fold pyridoxal phosphate-dependent enzyme [Candidatus Puniceispirillum sp.]